MIIIKTRISYSLGSCLIRQRQAFSESCLEDCPKASFKRTNDIGEVRAHHNNNVHEIKSSTSFLLGNKQMSLNITYLVFAAIGSLGLHGSP